MSHTQNYVTALQTKYAVGNATEHTYRPPMENYLHALLDNVEATNESKRQACGMPDFVLTKTRKGQPIDIGYIEAKDVGVNLDKVEKTDQMKRYLQSLDNLILTDYLEFRFFKEQTKVATVRIAEVIDGAITPIPDQYEKLESLLHDFVEYTGQTIKSPSVLAKMMARKAQLMRNVFEEALNDETHRSSLHDQLGAFQKILIHDMDAAQFADVYAQTIAYGLFTARLHDHTLEDFSRQEARDLIPRSNPFLRNLFDYVCGADLDSRVVWIVDALCEVYRAANVHDILHGFGKQSGRNDPIVHFYETFLAEYDPKLRKSRGVWYTPEPVVNFIVRAVDEVLKTHFHLPEGLADTSKVTIEIDDQHIDNRTKSGKAKKKVDVHKVQLLDVAAGTGTFTAEAIKQIYQRFVGQEGMWSQYVEEHLLPRLHGFEILMASYAMCHLKIDLLLTELGYKPSNPNHPPRLGVYLTNSLEEYHPDEGTLFASWLAREANEASRIKRDMPIMVAYGNPPYSGESTNKGNFIMELMEAYKKEPEGKEKLKERNPKWLNDDYVKFIRLGEHYIERNGEGVLAYITNHGYLDNPTFRGMRWHLLDTFDDIYILDLHGNAKKKEVSPDGSPDKNVFDIMQGVSVIIAVKHDKSKQKLARVHHAEFWGSRKDKYEALWESSIDNLVFQLLNPSTPNYLFIPFDDALGVNYSKGFHVNEFFPVNSVGIVTSRDHFVIDSNKDNLTQRIQNFFALPDDDAAKKDFNLTENKSFKIADVRNNTAYNHECIAPISYRPFDSRFLYYDDFFIERNRRNVMQNMKMGDNLGLVIGRQGQVVGSMSWNLVSICNGVADFNLFYRGGVLAHPLYLYPNDTEKQPSLDAAASDGKRRPNLDEKIVAEIAKKIGIPFVPDHEDKAADDHACFSPLDLLDYIYAVLHSPTYRETYKEFLKIDFPRIPYPDNTDTFWKLAALGSELRAFHLLEHPALTTPITQFPESGDCMVETIGKSSLRNVQDGKGDVYINDTQYFAGVPEIAWNFYIGGYQPAQKWLKDRKDRTLTFEDIRHYQKIIVALTNTDRLMKAIDETWKP